MIDFEELENRKKFFFHYACTSLKDKKNKITCISIFNPEEKTNEIFSINNYSEKDLLEKFFDFIKGRSELFIDWFISEKYNIKIIQDRYKEISKRETKLDSNNFIGLLPILQDKFEKRHIVYPKLKGITLLNNIDITGFYSGEEEAELSKKKKYQLIEKSCSKKVEIVHKIYQLAVNDDLEVNNRIKKIIVCNLLGKSNNDYVLDFNYYPKPLIILHGKNGTGKTTVLKLINHFIKREYDLLNQKLFRSIELFLCSGDSCKLEYDNQAGPLFYVNGKMHDSRIGPSWINYFLLNPEKLMSMRPKERNKLRQGILEYLLRKREFSYKSEMSKNDRFEEMLLEDLLRALDRGEIKNLRKISSAFRRRASIVRNELHSDEEMNKILKTIQSIFISTERLQESILSKWLDSEDDKLDPLGKIQDDLKRKFSAATKAFTTKSQKLDSTFVYRISEQFQDLDKNKTEEDISDELNKLDERRLELINLGIIEDDPNPFQKISDVESDLIPIFYAFIKDRNEKYDELNEIKESLTSFIDFVNEHLEGKVAKIKNNKLIFQSEDRDDLILTLYDLSSGEKHITLLAYYLIFMVPFGSVLMIDEPEISLHISWQRNLIKDLLTMGDNSKLQFILATHSPDIVAGFRNHLYPLELSQDD